MLFLRRIVLWIICKHLQRNRIVINKITIQLTRSVHTFLISWMAAVSCQIHNQNIFCHLDLLHYLAPFTSAAWNISLINDLVSSAVMAGLWCRYFFMYSRYSNNISAWLQNQFSLQLKENKSFVLAQCSLNRVSHYNYNVVLIHSHADAI